MEALTEANDNVKLVRININAWESEVAAQFGIRRLPTVWLYDGQDRVLTDAMEVVQRIRNLN